MDKILAMCSQLAGLWRCCTYCHVDRRKSESNLSIYSAKQE